MSDEPGGTPPKSGDNITDQIGAKAARKLKARRHSHPGVWFGLGMMGLIGWSVVGVRPQDDVVRRVNIKQIACTFSGYM